MKPKNYGDGLFVSYRILEEEDVISFNRGLNFKLACILEGTGKYSFQKALTGYGSGDIFVIVPNEDTHKLFSTERTGLLLIDFSSLFFGKDNFEKVNANVLHLLQNANQSQQYLGKLRERAPFLQLLIKSISRECQRLEPVHSPEYIRSLVHTILVSIAENVKACLPKHIIDRHLDQRLANMLHYIHQNIFDPEKLTTYELSKKFFISQTYVGRYFKNNTNCNLHQYIMHYKIKLIENRLINSSMRINEIADEFGFADKSYLNKLFAKYKGMSPLAYRKIYRNGSVRFSSYPT